MPWQAIVFAVCPGGGDGGFGGGAWEEGQEFGAGGAGGGGEGGEGPWAGEEAFGGAAIGEDDLVALEYEVDVGDVAAAVHDPGEASG